METSIVNEDHTFFCRWKLLPPHPPTLTFHQANVETALLIE
jgi:hypothetical protein